MNTPESDAHKAGQWIEKADGWHFDDGLGGKWFLTHEEMTSIRGDSQ